jgi:flagellin-like hook-associated protein FlgL
VTSNLNPKSQLFLVNVDRIQDSLSAATNRLSSGLRVSQASDAPDQISPLLQLRARLSHNTQLQTNLGLAKANTSTADSALASAITLIDSAETAAAKVASDFTTDGGETAISQIQSIQQQMLAISNTVVQGSYIFSGDDSRTAAYAADSNGASPETGVVQVSTAAATRQVEDPSGGSFSASKTARDIFDSRDANGAVASGNVFAALQSVITAIQSSDTSAIQSAIGDLKLASQHLNDAEAFYGVAETRIQSAEDSAATLSTQLQTQIGQIQDADTVADALEITQANTQLSAAFQAEALISRKTLFDYLS